MLKRSSLRCVVFTQAYPFLADFARRNFLPENPLSSSPLWLDENDFLLAQQRAARLGVASLLRINPLSHHPEKSPFLKATSRRKTRGRRSRPSARTRDMDSATATSAPQTEEQPDAVRAAAATAGAVTKEPAASRWRQHEAAVQGRARSSPSSQAPLSYSVPICTVDVYRHLYLYNLDQMMMDLGARPANDPGLLLPDRGEQERRQLRELGDSSNSADRNQMSVEERIRFTAKGSFLSAHSPPLYDPSEPTSFARDDPWAGTLGDFKDTTFSDQQADGARMLRVRFPNPRDTVAPPASASGRPSLDSGGGAAAYSIKTGRGYAPSVQAQLQRLMHLHGYRSRYWGTLMQWKAVGATAQYKEREHLAYVAIRTKLVHISLLDNAQALLQNSFISAKSGIFNPFVPITPDLLRRVREATQASGCVDAHEDDTRSTLEAQNQLPSSSAIRDGSVADRYGHPHVSPHAAVSSQSRSATSGVGDDTFQQAILTDMRVHKYAVPLYFSGLQLLTHRLTLKPQALGIDLQALKAQQAMAMTNGGAGIPPSIESVYVGEPHTPAPPPPFSAYTPAASPWRLSARLLSGQHGPVDVRHFYHLSQVHFPRGFTIPLRVVTAELEAAPRVALHGVTGRVLPCEELTAEAVRNAYPEVGAVLWERLAPVAPPAPDFLDVLEQEIAAAASPPAASPLLSSSCEEGDPALRREALMAMSDDDFAALVRARVSPTNVSGRSLWFLAEDVLKLDGVVDVNATPIEVRSAGGAGSADGEGGLDSAGGAALVNNRALYNVECLVNPDEGYRIVNQRVPGAGPFQ